MNQFPNSNYLFEICSLRSRFVLDLCGESRTQEAYQMHST